MTDRRAAFEQLDEPQIRGDASEAIIKGELVARGVSVLDPEYDNEPFDLVIEVDGSFYRVQCKTAYGNTDGVVRFEPRKTRVKSTGYERDNYSGEIEYFAVYNPRLDEVYLVPYERTPETHMKIRFEETANDQHENVNWREEFLLETQLEAL